MPEPDQNVIRVHPAAARAQRRREDRARRHAAEKRELPDRFERAVPPPRETR